MADVFCFHPVVCG